ncbi:MAG: helix-turn-helix domain-containing protein [Nitrospirae bacterium]|nr:helix-turn-helix domain-containing protein [Nitrospirota bacterium]
MTRIPIKKELFDELLKSVKQGGAIMKRTMKPARTFTFAESEVKKIRDQYGLSQDKFAILMGISTATLRNWEQGRRAYCCKLRKNILMPCSILRVTGKQRRQSNQRVRGVNHLSHYDIISFKE